MHRCRPEWPTGTFSLRSAGRSRACTWRVRAMARALARSPATISRELSRRFGVRAGEVRHPMTSIPRRESFRQRSLIRRHLHERAGSLRWKRRAVWRSTAARLLTCKLSRRQPDPASPAVTHGWPRAGTGLATGLGVRQQVPSALGRHRAPNGHAGLHRPPASAARTAAW